MFLLHRLFLIAVDAFPCFTVLFVHCFFVNLAEYLSCKFVFLLKLCFGAHNFILCFDGFYKRSSKIRDRERGETGGERTDGMRLKRIYSVAFIEF